MVYKKYGGNDSKFTPQQLKIMDDQEKAEKKRQEEAEKKVKQKE